jgi:hypothetical protein
MDLPAIASSPVVSAPAPTDASTAVALKAQFAEANKDNFPKLRELAAIVLDSTGAYSDDAKIEAWQTQFQMAVTGKFRGASAEDADLMNQIGRSDTHQQIEAARVQYANTVAAAIHAADAAGLPRGEAVGRAALKHFDGLAATDQKRLFASINAPDQTGATPYGSVDDWRTQMMTLAKLFAPIEDKLDLSTAAKKTVGDFASSKPTAAPYRPGANATVTA